MKFLRSFPHMYEYHLECVITLVASISFNFFSLSLSHCPNHSSRHHHLLEFLVLPLLLHLPRIFFNFQNRTCTEPLLHYEVHEFSFPTSPYSPKIDSEQESYVHFIPALQSVLTNFRTRSVQYSCHISLYVSSNSLI